MLAGEADAAFDGRDLEVRGEDLSESGIEVGVKRDVGNGAGNAGSSSRISSMSTCAELLRLETLECGLAAGRSMLIRALALPLLMSKETRGRRAIFSGEGEELQRSWRFDGGVVARLSTTAALALVSSLRLEEEPA